MCAVKNMTLEDSAMTLVYYNFNFSTINCYCYICQHIKEKSLLRGMRMRCLQQDNADFKQVYVYITSNTKLNVSYS